jgi:chromosome segregation ATPase
MKMAITGQQHVDALVGYYRSEIDKYNDERAEWALSYEQLKDNSTNKYTLQQEIDSSRQRINHLDAELSTTKANLAHQRQKYFEKLEDNQAVKDKLEENKRRYREMMAICKPINVSKKKIADRANSSKQHIERSSNSSRISASSEGGRSKGEVELELLNLGREHDEKRAGLQRYIDSLKDELDELVSEHSERGKNCSGEYKQALESLALVEGKIMHLTSEYFKLRMDNYEEERRIQEENEILRLKTVAMAKRLQMLRDSHTR